MRLRGLTFPRSDSTPTSSQPLLYFLSTMIGAGVISMYVCHYPAPQIDPPSCSPGGHLKSWELYIADAQEWTEWSNKRCSLLQALREGRGMLEKMPCDPVGVKLDSSLALWRAEEASSSEIRGGLWWGPPRLFVPATWTASNILGIFLDDTSCELVLVNKYCHGWWISSSIVQNFVFLSATCDKVLSWMIEFWVEKYLVKYIICNTVTLLTPKKIYKEWQIMLC